MLKTFLPAAALALTALAAAYPAAAPAQPRAGEAARSVRQGDILPLNVIRQRVQIDGATLIGADMIGASTYRLRFMRGSSVLFVDVDARTGRVFRCIGC